MIVLSRKCDEEIMVGDDIRIVLLEITNPTVLMRVYCPGIVFERTMQLNEECEICDGVSMILTKFRGNKVRLGVEAPNLPVHRREIYEDIKNMGRRQVTDRQVETNPPPMTDDGHTQNSLCA